MVVKFQFVRYISCFKCIRHSIGQMYMILFITTKKELSVHFIPDAKVILGVILSGIEKGIGEPVSYASLYIEKQYSEV